MVAFGGQERRQAGQAEQVETGAGRWAGFGLGSGDRQVGRADIHLSSSLSFSSMSLSLFADSLISLEVSVSLSCSSSVPLCGSPIS